MSETLKANLGEASKTPEANSSLKSLEAMANDFNPKKAEALRVMDKKEEKPKEKTEDRAMQHLMVLQEKQNKELSPKDAANEYLSLLDDLSKDFTNPYYGEERKGDQHYANNITTDLGKKYSENPHYRWKGYAGTEAGEKDGTMLRIASADNILANEIAWREEGKKVGDRLEKFDTDISDLRDKYSKKGRLGKFFGKRKYKKALESLETSKRVERYKFDKKYNDNIAKELAISYNNRNQNRNETDNRQFFGLDDPKRAAKIERAIELRKKYESEWNKKDK